MSRVRFFYGVFQTARTLSRVQDGWRLPALRGLRSAEDRELKDGLRQELAALRHAHGPARARLRLGIKELRPLAPELARAHAGKSLELASLSVAWPHFGLGEYAFCVA